MIPIYDNRPLPKFIAKNYHYIQAHARNWYANLANKIWKYNWRDQSYLHLLLLESERNQKSLYNPNNKSEATNGTTTKILVNGFCLIFKYITIINNILKKTSFASLNTNFPPTLQKFK